MEFLYVLGIIFVFFLLSFALINIRYIFTGNEFRGTCGQTNAKLRNEIGECTVCGKKGDDLCALPEPT